MGLSVASLTDDWVWLERYETNLPALVLPNGDPIDDLIPARVLAAGPGGLTANGGRFPMPCQAGDIVLVRSTIGYRWQPTGALELAPGQTDRKIWLVQAQHSDVVAVLKETP